MQVSFSGFAFQGFASFPFQLSLFRVLLLRILLPRVLLLFAIDVSGLLFVKSQFSQITKHSKISNPHLAPSDLDAVQSWQWLLDKDDTGLVGANFTELVQTSRPFRDLDGRTDLQNLFRSIASELTVERNETLQSEIGGWQLFSRTDALLGFGTRLKSIPEILLRPVGRSGWGASATVVRETEGVTT